MHESLSVGHSVAGYRLLRLLGQGAQGVVYLAQASHSALPVALKLVSLPADASAHAAFMHHATLARRLLHPGIVALHAAGVDGSLGWLAMQAVPGTDLGRYTHPQRLLPEPVVLQVTERIAQALAHAHRQGVVHRDLKPANVLVDWPSNTVKLADFSIARVADAAQTATGIVLGSPSYMAPEQLAGSVPTPHSDFYALGVMLFQLLAGRLPHEGTSMGELLRQVAAEPAPDLRLLRPQTAPAVAALVASLLAKRPAQRLSDGDALAAALRAAAAALPVTR